MPLQTKSARARLRLRASGRHSFAFVITVASLITLPLAGAAYAERLGKGSSLVFIGVGGHRAQLIGVTPPIVSFPGAVFRTDVGEVGGEVAYSRFFCDQWALGLSGSYHASRARTALADLAGVDVTETHSYTVRIGGDRFAFIDDGVAVYAGPGVFVTRGRWKSSFSGGSDEGPDATEAGLNVRIGFYTRLGKGWALVGHLGQNLSRTSGKNSIGETSWWSSTHEGAMGLAVDF